MLTDRDKAAIAATKKTIEETIIKRDLAKASLAKQKKRLQELEDRYEGAVVALEVIQEVTKETHKLLELRISELVSAVLLAVWGGEYNFETELRTRKDAIECYLWLTKNGRRIHPMRADGGGVCDVTDWGCRLSWFSLDPVRPTFALDEMFKFVNGAELQERTSEMLKTIAEELGIQIIMASNKALTIDCADKVFDLKLVDDVTTVTVSDGQASQEQEQTKPRKKKIERVNRYDDSDL